MHSDSDERSLSPLDVMANRFTIFKADGVNSVDLPQGGIEMARGPGKSLLKGAERRQQSRMNIRGSAAIRTRHGVLTGEAVDISPAGVCLTVPEPLHIGGIYSLDLHLHGEPESDVSVIARVCFCIEERDGFRVGMNCTIEPPSSR